MKFYKTSIFQKILTEFCNYSNTSGQIEYCVQRGFPLFCSPLLWGFTVLSSTILRHLKIQSQTLRLGTTYSKFLETITWGHSTNILVRGRSIPEIKTQILQHYYLKIKQCYKLGLGNQISSFNLKLLIIVNRFCFKGVFEAQKANK